MINNWYESLKNVKEFKDDEELQEIIKTIIELEIQKHHSSHSGMISALMKAQQLAQEEVKNTISSHGGIVISKPWSDFSNDELYHMLQYHQDSLMEHGRKKVGKNIFEKLLEDTIKKINWR